MPRFNLKMLIVAAGLASLAMARPAPAKTATSLTVAGAHHIPTAMGAIIPEMEISNDMTDEEIEAVAEAQVKKAYREFVKDESMLLSIAKYDPASEYFANDTNPTLPGYKNSDVKATAEHLAKALEVPYQEAEEFLVRGFKNQTSKMEPREEQSEQDQVLEAAATVLSTLLGIPQDEAKTIIIARILSHFVKRDGRDQAETEKTDEVVKPTYDIFPKLSVSLKAPNNTNIKFDIPKLQLATRPWKELVARFKLDKVPNTEQKVIPVDEKEEGLVERDLETPKLDDKKDGIKNTTQPVNGTEPSKPKHPYGCKGGIGWCLIPPGAFRWLGL